MTRVLFVGTMGTGKSTVGTLVAEALDCALLDNDELLLARSGRTAPELAAESEELLRAEESAVLRDVLRRPGPWVAGAPAGVVLDALDRQVIRESGAHVVWLTAPADVLARRVGSGEDRPWLGSDPEAALQALVAERAPLYAEVADQVLDVASLAPREAAAAVVKALDLPG